MDGRRWKDLENIGNDLIFSKINKNLYVYFWAGDVDIHPSANKINTNLLPKSHFYSILDYEFKYSQTTAEKKAALLDHITKAVLKLESVDSVFFVDDQWRNTEKMEEYLGPYCCILVAPADIFRMKFAIYKHIERLIKLIKNKREGLFLSEAQSEQKARFTPRICSDC